MTVNARYTKKLSLIITVIFLYLAASGCGSKQTKLPVYMRPELLYLNEQPYSRLYIEVDMIEGVEVPEQWLDVLREFLSTHCSKPDGIEIVVDDPVPFDDIKDMPIGPASILCMDGPYPNMDSQPAYLHVFFYDKEGIFKKTTKKPHVYSPCTTTIFYNVDYGRPIDKTIRFCLSHEAGHVLGLCKDKSHGDGAHCSNSNCLMNPSPGLLEELGLLLLGIPFNKPLCADRVKDLATYKSEEADSNLIFDGPFLIRKEDGYSVAMLPYCNFIIPQFLEEKFDWHKLLKEINDMSEQMDEGKYWENNQVYRIRGIFMPNNKDGSPPDINLLKESLGKATEDPNPIIRQYAASELEKIELQKNSPSIN